MLGHIHKHQSWESDGRRIAYPGSIGRLHFGEAGEKGFLLWTTTAEMAESEFIPTPARKMLSFDFTGRPDVQALKQRVAESEGALVRIRWEVGEEDRQGVDREAIAALFADAASLKLEERVIPVNRSRAEGISRAVTLADKVGKWGGATGVATGAILERLDRVESMEVEDIVRQVLRDDDGDSGLQVGALGKTCAVAAAR